MWQYFFFVCIVFIANTDAATNGATGCVELDEISFRKITKKFEASLIKFDVAFPYGDKHDAFVAIARDAQDVDDLLVAEVGVKDYGEKENEVLARKYGASKDNFPMVKLFIKGKMDPISFDESNGFTSNALRRFVRENTGLYLSLPGCIKELDQLAIKFMKKNTREERRKVYEEADHVARKLSNKEVSAKIYRMIMEKILEKGNGFVTSEYDRVNKLSNGKVSDEKKKELAIRLNILQTFQLVKAKRGKEEL